MKIKAFILSVFLIAVFSFTSWGEDTQNRDYKIGDVGPAGGWIFYDKGNTSDGWRYLEVSSKNVGQGEVPFWDRCDDEKYNCGDYRSWGTDIKIGSGKSNTQKIIDGQGNGNYAAKLCFNYRGGGKSDWFLPSLNELKMIHKNLFITNIVPDFFMKCRYWSSSEVDTNGMVYSFNFFNPKSGRDGYHFPDIKTKGKYRGIHVRAVRSF